MLNLFRSTEIRFSVPSSCACRSAEILGGGQFRIIFGDYQQAREGIAQLALRRLKFFELLRIGWRLVRIELHSPNACSRVSHFGKRRFLEIGRAGTVFTEIRNQIRAPLIHGLDLGPLGVDGLLQTDQPVVSPPEKEADDESKEDENDEESAATDRKFVHKIDKIGPESFRKSVTKSNPLSAKNESAGNKRLKTFALIPWRTIRAFIEGMTNKRS